MRYAIGKEGQQDKTIKFFDRKQDPNYNYLESDQNGDSLSYHDYQNHQKQSYYISPQHSDQNYYRPEPPIVHHNEHCPANKYQDYPSTQQFWQNQYQVHESHCPINELNHQACQATFQGQPYVHQIDGQHFYQDEPIQKSNANYDPTCKS